MATFYLLPPRPVLDDSLARFVGTWLPDLPASAAGFDLAGVLDAAVARRADAYLVFREDLPDGVDADQALRDGFGADWGDTVVEMRLGGRPGEVISRLWHVGDVFAA